MATMSDFVRKHGVSMTSEEVGASAADEKRWGHGATHWRCTIRYGRRSMTVPFHQGSAHTEEPTVEDVLNSIALDVSGLQNAGSFDEWAAEYGMEFEPECARYTKRQAEEYGLDCAAYFDAKETYRAVQSEETKLARLFNDGEIVNELLYHTESL